MYSVVITAAGCGKRANLGYNKMLYRIAGKTVLETAVETFCNNRDFNQIIVTASYEDKPIYEQILDKYNVEIVTGGQERMNSVYAGISKASNNKVFVHDGARVYLEAPLIDRLTSFSKSYDGLALGIKATDTTLLVVEGQIKQILNRDNLFNMQTPQVVERDIYMTCYQKAEIENKLFTDEMSMLTNYGYNCHVVNSEAYNIKLTHPEDFKE